MVGARGFEPPTPCAQGRCASQAALRPEFINIMNRRGKSQIEMPCKKYSKGIIPILLFTYRKSSVMMRAKE